MKKEIDLKALLENKMANIAPVEASQAAIAESRQ